MAPYIRFLHLLLAALFISCKPGLKQHAFTLPAATDINDAVQAVLSNKKYPVPILAPEPMGSLTSVRAADLTGKPLSIDLCRLKIINPPPKETGTVAEPAPSSAIYVSELMHLGQGGKPFFNPVDSAYLLFQSDNLLSFQLSKANQAHICYTSRPALDSVYRATGHIAAFECSIPVFSEDRKRAYLTLTYQCDGLCAYSLAFILEKKDSRWQVLKGWTLWIS